jgi:hypothetical protein
MMTVTTIDHRERDRLRDVAWKATAELTRLREQVGVLAAERDKMREGLVAAEAACPKLRETFEEIFHHRRANGDIHDLVYNGLDELDVCLTKVREALGAPS